MFFSHDSSDSSGGKEQLQIVSIQFNSLDVIANQETIVELLSFVKRVSPPAASQSGQASAKQGRQQHRRRLPTRDTGCQTTDDPMLRSGIIFIRGIYVKASE